ncbi:MAG TPA: hypothetical protein VNC79_07070, partial [Mycobacteriales bacterium]|nr:hypothetical protein [Mycobacteriales bacterium]
VILAVTTLVSVVRLAGWGTWTSTRVALAVGFGVVAVGCAALLVLLAGRPAAEWLVRRPGRRPAPLWVVTAGVFVGSYLPLMFVPALVSAGRLPTVPPLPASLALALVVGWFALIAVVYTVLPPVVFFLRRGHRWARAFALALSVVVLVTQPLLCAALLGVEGLIGDGVPIAVSAVLAVWGLAGHRAGREFFRRRSAAPAG